MLGMVKEPAGAHGPTDGGSCRGWALFAGVLCALAVLLGQYLTVHYNHAQDWSALFYSGVSYPTPPELAWESHRRSPGGGYDGQIYHVIAHDPFMRHGFDKYIDAPRLRYRRILLPLAAYAAALGQAHRVDRSYRGVVLLCVFLGGYWCARYAILAGRSAAWGLLFALLPAVVVSAERMTVDVALVALTAAFAVYAKAGPTWKLGLVVALAALTRETGVLLAVALLALAVLRRSGRSAVTAVLALAPAALWFAYVQQRTPAYDYRNSFVPMSGIVQAFLDPAPPPTIEPGQVAPWWRATMLNKRTFDRVALAGAVFGFGLAFAGLRRRPWDALTLAALLFAALGVFVQRPDNWLHVYDFGRVYSPLLVLLGLRGLGERSYWPAMPFFLMWPRLLIELMMDVLAVLRGLLA